VFANFGPGTISIERKLSMAGSIKGGEPKKKAKKKAAPKKKAAKK
jgi:hypothetical protein